MHDCEWKPLIICPNVSEARQVRSVLMELGIDDGHLVSQYPQKGAIGALAAQRACNICFLDIASQPEEALALVSEAAASMPVVILNPQKDADLILRCLRLGACEFLSEPTADQVRDLLARLSRLNAPAETHPNSRVFCVVPGKAGSGASTVATYLALEMKRSGASRVLLVDSDPATGSVAFLLRLKPAHHMGDAVRDWNRMDADLWSRLVSPCQGIDVLPAPEDPAAPLHLDPPTASGLMAFWREHYDAVVLDTAGAASEGSEFAALADSVLVITTNDLSAVHATQRSLTCLQKGPVDRSRIKLIITRYVPALGLKREEVESALKLTPYALLRNEWDVVQNALLDGRPLPSGSSFGLGLRTLADRLLGREKTIKKRAAFFGLLTARAEGKG
jgi:pilus assembly protein CpaE